MNPRITPKERGLLKGAIRRVFSRSELRRRVVEASVFKGSVVSNRKRVKTWCVCAICQELEPKSYMQCDHKDPLVPIDKTLEDMTWDTIVDRTWCEENNLQAVCKECHKAKTKAENKSRREYKKGKK